MTTHPRSGDKKRTLNKKEVDALQGALQRDINAGGASQYHLDLLADLRQCKRLILVTPRTA